MKISQHHRIITMEEYTVINPVEHLASKSVYCCNHNMPLHFFCGSCKVPVCVGCTLVEHPISDGHNIINIETAFESFAKLSESFINKAEENLIKFHDIAKQLKIKEELEMSNYKECEVKITEEANKAHQLIDRYKKDQLQDLESSHQHNLKLISANESEVELAIAKFSSTQGIVRTLIHSPNHAMALRSSSDVTKRMDELVEQDNISDDILTPNLVKYKNTRFEVKTVDILHGNDDYEAIMTLPKASLKTEDRIKNWLWKDLAKLWTFNKDTYPKWKEHEGHVVTFCHTNSGKMQMLVLKIEICISQTVTADSEMKAVKSSGHAWVWSDAEMKKYALIFKEPQFARKIKDDFDEYKKLANEVEVTANEKQQTKKQPKETNRKAIKPCFSWQPTTASDSQQTTGISFDVDSTSKEVQQKALPDSAGVNFGKSMFKPKVGTWTCDTCLVNNAPDTVKCLACATLKPGAAPPQSAAASTKPSGATGFRFVVPTSSPQTSKFSFGACSGACSGPVNDVKSQSGFSFGKPADVADSKSSEFYFGQSTGGSFGQASGKPTSGFSFGKSDDGNKANSTTSKPSGFSFGHTSDSSQQPPTGGFSFVADSSKTASPVQPKAVPIVTTDDTAEKSMILAERLKPKPGSWSCPTCYCQNSTEQKKCPACQTCQPGSQPEASSSTAPFGQSTGGASLPSTGFSFGQASSKPTSGFSLGKSDDGNKANSTTSKPSGFSFCHTSDSSQQPPTGGFSFVVDSSKTASPVQPKAAPIVTTDVTAEKSMTLAERLKPKPGSWSCPTCYCQNSAEQKKCPACQTCQPGSQPEASSSTAPSSSSFQFGSSSAFGQLQRSSQEGAVAPTSPTKTFSFGSSGKAFSQYSFGEGGETTDATSKPVSTGFTFGATPASSGFLFGNLSSPEKTGSPSCKFSEIPKSFTFQFKINPQEAANVPPASPTKSLGIIHFEPVVQLDLVELTTGEEDEETEFCHRAKMYRFNKKTNEWKERGCGDIKILRHKVTGLYRLLMRREKVLKLCANHFIFPEIVLRPNSGSDRSWVWTAMDASDDGQVKSELLAVRFKTAETATKFKAAFENAKEAVKKIKSIKKSEPAEVKETQEINKDEVKEIENEEGTEYHKMVEFKEDEEYEDDDDDDYEIIKFIFDL
ncbi:uncharacterized protein [Antedon mediterranea]|uniref:uncharacterized protein n=1 Tax=Antedon mediterranea TaxID=105859 RepID=UPI003AF8718A